MCPSAIESVPVGIDIHSPDEELVLFLDQRKPGDATPDNVVTEVNPFNVEPWNSPENIWYLYHSGALRSPNGNSEMKVTRSGYWKPTNDLKIYTSTCAIGRKMTLEFYSGKEPFGERTGWVMYEYQAEQHMSNGYNSSKKNYGSLCRVFQQTDRRTNQEENFFSASAGDSGGEYIERILLTLLEKEEGNSSSRISANNSQTVAEKGQEQSALSSRRPDEPLPENSNENMFGTCDFSNGEFLEINDLYCPEIPSASSDNSSLMSVNSDEFFDTDALLRDIETDHGLGVEEELTYHRFSISVPTESSQVVIRPSPPGISILVPFHCSSINRTADLVIEDSNPASWLIRNGVTSHPEHSSSTDELWHDGKASTTSKSQGSQDNRIADTTHRRRTLKGNGLKSVRKIAKIGRKYCCFGSF
nr:PREDICTED: NAC domain-containing protein 72-like isoform X5 [Musa acuminata subsp. malaccensis]XP_009411039.1 PREDICTED: NAC domain-containing protein 72-like isoform X5 [Musa acuminata subsp. malaccensis]